MNDCDCARKGHNGYCPALTKQKKCVLELDLHGHCPYPCLDGQALIARYDNPTAGRLVFMPWQAGGKVIPKFQEDKGEVDYGGRC